MPSNPYLKYTGMAFQWIITLGLAVYGGLKADKYFRFKFPWFTITLPLVALSAMLYKVYKDAEKESKSSK
jgi:hypothetical protein